MLVQLSGVSGSGKSTLARSIAEATGFVVVDTDVLDSPCRYPQLLAEASQVARDASVRHAFIELWASDPPALLPRLDHRLPRASQVASSSAPVPGTDWELGTPEKTLSAWQSQLVRPEQDWLRLDAEVSVEANLADALAYLA